VELIDEDRARQLFAELAGEGQRARTADVAHRWAVATGTTP
jgi:hypothetical protein